MASGFWKKWFSGDAPEQPASAQTAADRLRVIVASEHRLSNRLHPEKIERMKREILGIVNKYVNGVNLEDVVINHRSEAEIDMLEMNINLPEAKVTPRRPEDDDPQAYA